MSNETEAQPEILFAAEAGLGRVVLNRPRALNALTLGKVRDMAERLADWAAEDAIHCIVVEGAGERAFCAGGDIRRLWEARRDGDETFVRTFFATEYRLNRLIKVFAKPYVAIMDGVTMGGGVGISVHGSHRVATERTLFAMPETGIGMLADVGGTYFLPRLPGRLGLYMVLTGARLTAADCLYAGLATHYVPTARRDDLVQALSEAESDTRTAEEMQTAVTCILDMFHEEPGTAPLERQREQIDRCFAGQSVEDILDNLLADGSDWAVRQHASILEKSPMALKVAFRQMQIGAQLPFDRCMQTEYRVSPRMAGMADFGEGVRAVIVDKDNRPRWAPASLAEVDGDAVDRLFGPLDDGDLVF
jgi:enoyl-CoA hydratase